MHRTLKKLYLEAKLIVRETDKHEEQYIYKGSTIKEVHGLDEILTIQPETIAFMMWKSLWRIYDWTEILDFLDLLYVAKAVGIKSKLYRYLYVKPEGVAAFQIEIKEAKRLKKLSNKPQKIETNLIKQIDWLIKQNKRIVMLKRIEWEKREWENIETDTQYILFRRRLGCAVQEKGYVIKEAT